MTGIWTRYAGLIAAPFAWAITTQLGQILPYADCHRQISSSLAAVAAGAVVALVGVAASYLGQKQACDRAELFVGRLSIGVGLAFTFALCSKGLRRCC